MSDKKTVTASGNIGFAGALTILFIALKLTHVIDWPWLWVLSPIWISFGLLILLFGILIVIAIGAAVVGRRKPVETPYSRR